MLNRAALPGEVMWLLETSDDGLTWTVADARNTVQPVTYYRRRVAAYGSPEDLMQLHLSSLQLDLARTLICSGIALKQACPDCQASPESFSECNAAILWRLLRSKARESTNVIAQSPKLSSGKSQAEFGFVTSRVTSFTRTCTPERTRNS